MGLAAALAVGTLVPDLRPVIPYRLERAVACRAQRGGLPVDPGSSFQVGAERICVWFDGRAATRATPVRAEVWREDEVRLVCSRVLLVPRESGGGLFTLTLRSGAPLPVGQYRVDLTSDEDLLQVRFRVVEHAAEVPLAAPPETEAVLSNPAEGFSIAAPPGWETTELEESAMSLIHAGEPVAMVVVLVRYEPSATTVATVAEHLAHALGADADHQVIDRRTGVAGERATATLVVDRKGGDRFKIVVLPRETGPSARTFYGVVASCDRRAFAGLESEFDRIVRSFKVFTPRLP